MTPRRRFPMGLLLVLLVVVPLAEIWVLIQVGQVIGAWWTIALLVLISVIGGWLIRREGSRAWRALSEALTSFRMPARELADGMLIVAGGMLMLSPGFVTDAVGVLLILPLTRPVARRALTRALGRRLLDARHPGAGPQGPVVRGEVMDQ